MKNETAATNQATESIRSFAASKGKNEWQYLHAIICLPNKVSDSLRKALYAEIDISGLAGRMDEIDAPAKAANKKWLAEYELKHAKEKLLQLREKRRKLQHELDNDGENTFEWGRAMTRKIGAIKANETKIKKKHRIFPFN